jgi:hypothetical protein
MSKGIRICLHYSNTLIWRKNFNYHTGIEVVRHLIADRRVHVLATGSSEGAMVLHYEYVA